MKKVYIVQFDWSTFDEKEIELFVFDSFEKAYQKFQSLIADEMNPDNSWVGNLDWKNGLSKQYEFFSNKSNDEKQSPFWYITDLYNPEMYVHIDLFSKEVL